MMGTFPYNRNIFTDIDLAPLEITVRPLEVNTGIEESPTRFIIVHHAGRSPYSSFATLRIYTYQLDELPHTPPLSAAPNSPPPWKHTHSTVFCTITNSDTS